MQDIAAMKLDAIKGRGKKRDFYDMYFLLQRFSLSQLLAFHAKNFRQDTTFQILKSMVYFADAENDTTVELLRPGEVDWEKVKSFIRKKVDAYQAEN